ncbi:DNA-binding protein [Frigoriflavimonas asaccharolytica]|uniref:Helix-turn-helix protein n=1 Tax=Frigoriflavimonas asaccharolytica TaxID=2735899 RepID=A0A8J8G510_9FLAO|nr:DNA-binding protein [Frigoriflavimonas asaccharolytica]NRS91588.1 hypothetical protein [Frigoriflavimonas asaccharolytica]
MSKDEVILSVLNQLLEELGVIKENLFLSKKIFNVKDFSKYSGFKESYIYKIRGDINYSKPNGKMVFFKKDDVENYLLRNPSKSKFAIEQEAIEFSTKKK